MFLMPSLFEPCGLSQMIAMRYGTLPIVRETGGLRDSVIPYNHFTGEGTGFSFANFNGDEMRDCALEAAEVFWTDKDAWGGIMANAMGADFSWDRAARQYIDIYRGLHPEVELAAEKPGPDEKPRPDEKPQPEPKISTRPKPVMPSKAKAVTTPKPKAKAVPKARKTSSAKPAPKATKPTAKAKPVSAKASTTKPKPAAKPATAKASAAKPKTTKPTTAKASTAKSKSAVKPATAKASTTKPKPAGKTATKPAAAKPKARNVSSLKKKGSSAGRG
jgi:starch synthase